MKEGLLPFARQLRRAQTDAERRLWQALRAGRLAGAKFGRQQPMGGYIVDSVCFEQRLIVELDGGQHQEQAEYDDQRDDWLAGRSSRSFGSGTTRSCSSSRLSWRAY